MTVDVMAQLAIGQQFADAAATGSLMIGILAAAAAGLISFASPCVGCCCKVGRRLSFSFPDRRCVWAFSGRLEDPVDDHRVRVRLPVGKHRALPFPQ